MIKELISYVNWTNMIFTGVIFEKRGLLKMEHIKCPSRHRVCETVTDIGR